MSSKIDNILANLGATNSMDGDLGYSELQIGKHQIDTRFESTFDVIRKAALAENTPNILGTSDTCEAIVLRSEVVPPTPAMSPGGLDLVAYCKVLGTGHTKLLPTPGTLDPPDFRSQAFISAFPKFRYSSMVWGIIPAGVSVRVTFDPGSLSSGLLKNANRLAGAGAVYGPVAPPLPGLPNQFTNPGVFGNVTKLWKRRNKSLATKVRRI